MNKFLFPVNNPEPKPEPLLVKSLDDYLDQVQAIMLFNNITGFGLKNTKDSFELSFDSRANHITLREFGEWVKTYYKSVKSGSLFDREINSDWRDEFKHEWY